MTIFLPRRTQSDEKDLSQSRESACQKSVVGRRSSGVEKSWRQDDDAIVFQLEIGATPPASRRDASIGNAKEAYCRETHPYGMREWGSRFFYRKSHPYRMANMPMSK